MAETVIVDTGFLVAFLLARDTDHAWATAEAEEYPPPWHTCEAVLTELMFLVDFSTERMASFLRHEAVRVTFSFEDNRSQVFGLLKKYNGVPMSFADACLVRMTELLRDPVLLTTDTDFRVYRRHSRQVIPCMLPR